MSTLGKITTPTTGTHGYIADSGKPQVGMEFTVPAGGALFSSVTFWASGSSTLKLHGCIWDSATGNPLAIGPGVNTSGGAANGVGATQWYTDTFASPVFVAGGTVIVIGWQRDAASGTVYWAYNGSDHAPDSEYGTNSGSTGQHIFRTATVSPAGAAAAYATYTPGSVYADNGSAFVGGVLVYVDNGTSWQQCAVYVDDGTTWQRIG